jgi:HSP20 family molecular chaperone IbpA
MRAFELMDQMFAEMTERTRSQKIEAPDYSVTTRLNGDVIEIAVELPAYVSSHDISVQTEDGGVYVTIAAQGDRVALEIQDQMMSISAAKNCTREEKDDQGNVRAVSSGSSHMSQMISLPARIDIQRSMPKADVKNGVLTITLGVKGATRIAVTTSDEPSANTRKVQDTTPDVGRDVFKDTFEK